MSKSLHKYSVLLLLLIVILLSGCVKSTIKDDFCGVHINYQFCKCAFHNQYCDAVDMSKGEAKTFVYAEYNTWLEEQVGSDDVKYGVIEIDGKVYINSKPGEVLEIITSDLPQWAQGQIATVGASIAVVGPPDTIVEGDNNVLLDGSPIARFGDTTAHGGSITEGSENIFVNGMPVAFIGGYAVDPMVHGDIPSVGGVITNNN